ncbi:alpha/beta hydrolase [Virgibacillus sp. W0430]|uniref:alpha/beta hydrolase n=1 Tax=Virgibacillus sp. W0430 TaxID=3391580 RepID=UPI003F4549BF
MARKGTMIEKEITSTYLQETLALKIYQPESVNPLYRSTLCIMQDGDDYFQIGRIATLSDRLHDNDDIYNTTFVGIHYKDRFDRVKKYHPEGEQYDDYIRFLTSEVVPLLDELLPLNPLGIRRALMGDSLAATIALMTSMKHPDLFDAIILQSPLVDDAVFEEIQTKQDLSKLRIYHTIGQNETSVSTTLHGEVDFLTPNRKLHHLLKQINSHYTYLEFEGADHTWKHWQKDLSRAIKETLD